MKNILFVSDLILLSIFILPTSTHAVSAPTYDPVLLHSFMGNATDGRSPSGIVVSGNKVYGVTCNGGTNDLGVLYSSNLNGSSFTVLHSFTGSPTDGSCPNIGNYLSISGTKLYGMTNGGGTHADQNNSGGYGTIFSYDTASNEYTVLYSFDNTNGAYPYGAPTILNNKIYGMTVNGGTNGTGLIFSIDMTGNNFTVLHSFTGTPNDGANPYGSLTSVGSVLYGTTVGGGTNSAGTLFSYNTTGDIYTILHSFTGTSNDGANPFGSLAVDSNSVLYGTTAYGGTYGNGFIFSYDTNSSTYTSHVYSFTGGTSGANVYGSLTIYNDIIYGTTQNYGDPNCGCGVVFSYNPNTTTYTVLHSFTGSPNDGASPYMNNLFIDNSVLYGSTGGGGSQNSGVMFSSDLNGNNYNVIHHFAGYIQNGVSPYGKPVILGSKIYGTTNSGGDPNCGCGTIFSSNIDGSGYTVLHDFTGYSKGDGTYPQDSLILSGTTLYGMTANGGTNNNGTVFSYNTSGGIYTILHSFTGTSNDGANPFGSLTLLNGKLYGMTVNGGSQQYNVGIIFSIDPNGNNFSKLYTFGNNTNNSNGANPYGSLTASGNVLYGMTNSGGDQGYGVAFSYDTQSQVYTVLHSFTGSSHGDGAYPANNSFIISNSKLYGMTNGGGDPNCGCGTIFSMGLDGANYTVHHSFTGTSHNDGVNPDGYLTLIDSKLYGMTSGGGTNNFGTAFSINSDGTGYTVLHSFAGYPDEPAWPWPGSFTLLDSKLYAFGNGGGTYNLGSIFYISLTGDTPTPTPTTRPRHHSTGSSMTHMSREQIAQIFGLTPPTPPTPEIPPATPPQTPPASCTITHTLKLNSIYKDEVKCMQTKLNIKSDGIFGIKTKQAVNDFQKKNNLKADGVVGKETRKALGM